MIILIHGTDSFSSLNRAKEVFSRETKNYDSPETFNEDFSERSLEDLFQILEGHSLFSSSKTALIKNLSQNSKFKDNVDTLLKRFDNLPENLSLILWEEKKVPSNTKFGKFFKSKKLEELFEEKKRGEVKKIAQDLLAKHSVKMENDALDLFLFMTNHDIGFITREVDKLALFGKEVITIEDVKNIVPNSSESLIWDLTDAIIESDKTKALQAAENLMKNSSDQFILIPMIGRQIKIMIQVKKLLNDGNTYSQIASEMRLPPFIVNKVASYAHSADMNKLKRLFIKLVDMDFAIKTGKMDAEIAVSLFLSLL